MLILEEVVLSMKSCKNCGKKTKEKNVLQCENCGAEICNNCYKNDERICPYCASTLPYKS